MHVLWMITTEMLLYYERNIDYSYIKIIRSYYATYFVLVISFVKRQSQNKLAMKRKIIIQIG